MNYPFEFKALLLTNEVLDALGFTEYWAGCGDFGDRRLDLGGVVEDVRLTSKKEYPKYLIYVIDGAEQDEASGQGYGEPEHIAEHFCDKDFRGIYFLHEMFEDISKRRTPEELDAFTELTKKKGVNMFAYIRSYLEYKFMMPKDQPVTSN